MIPCTDANDGATFEMDESDQNAGKSTSSAINSIHLASRPLIGTVMGPMPTTDHRSFISSVVASAKNAVEWGAMP